MRIPYPPINLLQTNILAHIRDFLYSVCIGKEDLHECIDNAIGKSSRGISLIIRSTIHILKRCLPRENISLSLEISQAPAIYINTGIWPKTGRKYIDVIFVPGPYSFFRSKFSIESYEAIPRIALISGKFKVYLLFRRARPVPHNKPLISVGDPDHIYTVAARLFLSSKSLFEILSGESDATFQYYATAKIMGRHTIVRPASFECRIKSSIPLELASGYVLCETSDEREVLIYYSSELPIFEQLEHQSFSIGDRIIMVTLAPVGPMPPQWQHPPFVIGIYCAPPEKVYSAMGRELAQNTYSEQDISIDNNHKAGLTVKQLIGFINFVWPYHLVLKSEADKFVRSHHKELTSGKVAVEELFKVTFKQHYKYYMKLWQADYKKARRKHRIERIIHAVLWIAKTNGYVLIPKKAFM